MLLRVGKEIVGTFREHGISGGWKLVGFYLTKLRARLLGPGRSCPNCGWSGREFLPLFILPWGIIRKRVMCPSCGSFERHRAYFLFYRSFFASGGHHQREILHFAPEGCLEGVLRSKATLYRKSNYENAAEEELSLDLRELALPDESVDVLVMNYVLSCMPEDHRAVRSMYRVLRENGVVLAGEGLVPGQLTAELDTPGYGGRHRHYGMLDIAERFSPFEVAVVDISADFAEEERSRFGLNSPEHILVLKKSGLAPSAAAEKGERS